MDSRKRVLPGPNSIVVVRKCGVKFSPPALILLYRDEITGKQRRRSIPLRGFTASINVSTYIEELQDGNNKIFFNSIPQTQLFTLLERIKLGNKCSGSEENGPNSSKLIQSSLPPLTVAHNSETPIMKSLNMANLSHATAAESANKLNESLQFLLNFSDEGTQEDSSGSEKEVLPLKNSYSSTLKNPIPELKLSKQQSKKEGESNDAEDSQEISLGRDKMQDLNKLTRKELDQKKLEMDVLFEANRVKPGDPNYQYDLAMDFELGKMESGWDSNNSQSDF